MRSNLINEALIDAIRWQESLADACRGIDDMSKEAREQAARYRGALRRRTGTRMTPDEKALEGATTITLHELQKRTRSEKP